MQKRLGEADSLRWQAPPATLTQARMPVLREVWTPAYGNGVFLAAYRRIMGNSVMGA